MDTFADTKVIRIYEAIYFILLAGFLATLALVFFSFFGSLINVLTFRFFGAYIVFMIAMLIAGFNVPNLNLSWITFCTLIIGLLYSRLTFKKQSIVHEKKANKESSKSYKEILFTMFLLLILPSLDGNIFTQSIRGLFNIYTNLPYVFPVAWTILSGPGSWSLAAQIGATKGRREGVKYAILGGGVCTICALLATILGQVTRGVVPPLFSHVAAVAIFTSSIIIWHGREPPGKLLIIPSYIILFASILSLSSSEDIMILGVMASFIALAAITLAYRARSREATFGLLICLLLELLAAYFIELDCALKLIIFTHTPFMLLHSISMIGPELDKRL